MKENLQKPTNMFGLDLWSEGDRTGDLALVYEGTAEKTEERVSCACLYLYKWKLFLFSNCIQ